MAGLKVNSDTYLSGSNKLSQVADGANDPNSTMGDFHYNPATKSSSDCGYDANGNLNMDNNKQISSISYNYRNLPGVIHFTGKGTITYTYDAAGNKLQKLTVDSTVNPARTTRTVYLAGPVYQNDTVSTPIRKQFLVRVFRFSKSFCSTRLESGCPVIHVAFSDYTLPSIPRLVA